MPGILSLPIKILFEQPDITLKVEKQARLKVREPDTQWALVYWEFRPKVGPSITDVTRRLRSSISRSFSAIFAFS